MRFAGTRLEGFLNDDGPDYGEMTQAANTVATKEGNAMNDIGSQMAATGISTQAAVEAAEIAAEAQADAANSQASGAMFESIGSIGSSLLGGFGSDTETPTSSYKSFSPESRGRIANAMYQ